MSCHSRHLSVITHTQIYIYKQTHALSRIRLFSYLRSRYITSSAPPPYNTSEFSPHTHTHTLSHHLSPTTLHSSQFLLLLFLPIILLPLPLTPFKTYYHLLIFFFLHHPLLLPSILSSLLYHILR